ncbi:NADH-quinone oxidoreductase subunit C [Paenibacillus montanisoli]|uniref:NADH-quinone oxidoreductase subunit C n=1 Tax=Paenibacillus montanisoli TaxID=2081970 RepID=A0A328TUK1_9BACL|nr:NADH-quinone oxidoreductase subunit C [Paenibacillus montanisoli]RAP73990.1 NADH-quinone oxidoreductase subunit C [Paenibacillus montanisoli]
MSDEKEKELNRQEQAEAQPGEQEAEPKGEAPAAEPAAEAQPAEAAPSEPAAAAPAAEPTAKVSAAAPSEPAAAVDPEREAKLKAAAEARAARAAAKAAAESAENAEAAAVDPEREAKLKAAAEARAARAAAKAAAEGGDGGSGEAAAVDPEKEAKVKAAAEARAARAAAKAAAEGDAAPAEPKQPSPKQPQLDEAVALIRAQVGDDAIEEAYINELNGHLPTLVLKAERLLACAELLKTQESQDYSYLRNLSGVDYETHLETVYHLVSLKSGSDLALKVKADRENPQIPSVVSVWHTANWNEREVYDLLGIHFPGHPDLRRIMMPDDWVGYPLRKDYEPLDPEV